MATRDVSTEEIMRAQLDGWRNRLGGAEHLSMRELGDEKALRGIPAIGRGVQGTLRGSRPGDSLPG